MYAICTPLGQRDTTTHGRLQENMLIDTCRTQNQTRQDLKIGGAQAGANKAGVWCVDATRTNEWDIVSPRHVDRRLSEQTIITIIGGPQECLYVTQAPACHQTTQ